MQDLSLPSVQEVASARLQNKLLRDVLTKLRSQSRTGVHTGTLESALLSFLDLVTEERVLMEKIETDLSQKQAKYEQLLSEAVNDVKSSLRATKGPLSGLALLLDRESSEISALRHAISSEASSAAETLSHLKVTELEQDAELTQQRSNSASVRQKIPTLHKSGARINESHRSPLLKPIPK